MLELLADICEENFDSIFDVSFLIPLNNTVKLEFYNFFNFFYLEQNYNPIDITVDFLKNTIDRYNFMIKEKSLSFDKIVQCESFLNYFIYLKDKDYDWLYEIGFRAYKREKVNEIIEDFTFYCPKEFRTEISAFSELISYGSRPGDFNYDILNEIYSELRIRASK